MSLPSTAITQKYYMRLSVLSTHWTGTLAGMLVGLAWFYLLPAPLLDVPGLVLFLVLAWRRLDLALCVLPLSFPYWYVPKTVVGAKVFPLSEILLVGCCALFLLRRARTLTLSCASGSAERRAFGALNGLAVWVRRSLAILVGRVGPTISVGALVFALGGLIGVVIARRPADALRTYRWDIVEPLVYLALVVLVVRGRWNTRVMYWSMLASALVVAVLAYVQVVWLHLTFTPLANGNHLVILSGSGGVAGRATGIIYGNPNSLGAWLERALPLALAAAVAGRGLPRRERVVALGVGAFCVPPLLWSASRGAELGALVGCLLVVILVAIRPFVTVVLGGGLALLLLIWKHTALLNAALHGHGSTGMVRLLIWLAALRMIRDHPLFGIGPDQFQYYYSARYTSAPYWVTSIGGHPTTLALDPTLSHPHNLILDFWLSTGLLGLLAMGAVLLALARRIPQLWRASNIGPWPAALAVGAGSALLAGITHGMVDSGYFEPDLALFFWWAVAFLVTLERTSGSMGIPRGRAADPAREAISAEGPVTEDPAPPNGSNTTTEPG